MNIPPNVQTMMKLANVEAREMKDPRGLVFQYLGPYKDHVSRHSHIVPMRFFPPQLLVTPQDWVAAIASVMPEHNQ